MPQTQAPPLSKTRFTGGLQCLKNVYLASYSPKLADPISAAQQALFSMGTEVGVLARTTSPGGTLIQEPAFQHAKAVTHTAEVLADATIPALYEAGFETDGIRIRADIMVRNNDGSFDLIEVKSSTSVKAEHVPDTAVQVHVLEQAGLQVRRAFLMHINNRYVYRGGPYDVKNLFRQIDITKDVRNYMANDLPAALGSIREALSLESPPAIEIGPQCTTPYQCPFYGLCHKDEPEHAIDQLPRVNGNLLKGLRDSGVRDIREIPGGFAGLNQQQERVRNAVVSNEPYVGPGLSRALDDIEYPVHFLDFETFNPALPQYKGTRPYQVVPFQWSVHVLDSEGNIEHREFLHGGPDDPRPDFTSSLIEGIGPAGSIVVYSGYEQTVMSKLMEEYPERETDLISLTRRLVDLLQIIRAHYYHPSFHGSFSLKSVVPALVPGVGYSDLDIGDGSAAAGAYTRMLKSTDNSERLREQLLAYCERDTKAMVLAHAELLSVIAK